MKTATQRLWFPWTNVAERTTLEIIQYGCDITAALIMGLRSATLRRFEKLKSKEEASTSQEATNCSRTLGTIVRHANLGIASGAFKHYFLIADDEILSEDVELAICAFRKFRTSHPEFESFRLIVAGAVSPQVAKPAGHSTDGVENVRCCQLRGGEEELSRLYRYCYAVIAMSRHTNATASFDSARFGKPIISIRRAEHDENADRNYGGVLCEATPEGLASSMAQVASSGFIEGALG